MSNELAIVRFKDGTLVYTAYNGCGSSVNEVLRTSQEEVIADPFPDPDWDEWERDPNRCSLDEFYQRKNAVAYPDAEEVKIFTPYAGGISWSAKASRSAMRVTSGFSDLNADDSEDGTPSWAQSIPLKSLRKR